MGGPAGACCRRDPPVCRRPGSAVSAPITARWSRCPCMRSPKAVLVRWRCSGCCDPAGAGPHADRDDVADRVPRERLLFWTVSVRAAALALVCAAIVAELPLLVVLLLAGLESAFLGVTGLPRTRCCPGWRVPGRVGGRQRRVEPAGGTAVFVGPLLVGIALAVSEAAFTTAVATALMLASVVALPGCGSPASRFRPDRRAARSGRWSTTWWADTHVRRHRGRPLCSGLPSRRPWPRRADVLVVILAVDVLDIGEPGSAGSTRRWDSAAWPGASWPSGWSAVAGWPDGPHWAWAPGDCP